MSLGRFGVRSSRFMDDNMDGTGIIDMSVNGSTVPVDFGISPPAGSYFVVSRLAIQIRDNGTMDSGSYGNGITLTNGIRAMVIAPDDSEAEFTAQLPIKLNTDWENYGLQVSFSEFGAGNQTLTAYVVFASEDNVGGLVIPEGHKLVIRIADDLSALVRQTAYVTMRQVKA